MLIHNTTFHVEKDVHSEWLLYMKERYIVKATQSGLFHEPRLLLIQSQHNDDGLNYSLQFRTESKETLDMWFKEVGDNLQRTISARYGDKVLGFVTLLELVDL